VNMDSGPQASRGNYCVAELVFVRPAAAAAAAVVVARSSGSLPAVSAQDEMWARVVDQAVAVRKLVEAGFASAWMYGGPHLKQVAELDAIAPELEWDV
jgi:hypothetical protein